MPTARRKSRTPLRLEVQDAGDGEDFPRPREMRRVLAAAVTGPARLTVRLVGAEEGAELNGRYRQKSGATNVLAFDYGSVEGVIDGDIVLCTPVVREEAALQGRRMRDHCAHLLVHAALHLQGHTHDEAGDSDAMRRREAEILGSLGIAFPGEAWA